MNVLSTDAVRQAADAPHGRAEPDRQAQGAVTLGVSIINYRTAELTIQCVRSVLDDRGDIDLHIAVVDNASGDGSAEAIEAWIAAEPRAHGVVTLVRSPTNSGFSGGHNLGMAARKAAYYYVLNSDAMLRPGALAALLATAEANPQAGLVATRLEDEDGTPQVSCFRTPSWGSELIFAAHIGPLTRLLAHRNLPLSVNPDPANIEWMSFASILLRAEMVDRIGPMDEGFFLYSEDVEYCVRARRAGWALVFAPAARVVHFRGGSAPVKAQQRAKKRPPAYLYASRTRLHRIVHGRFGPLKANLAWCFGHALSRLRLLAGKAPNRGCEAEWRDIWINFLDPLGDSRKAKD